MISLADYWMGRDSLHPNDLTGEIEDNAAETCKRVSALLVVAKSAGVTLDRKPNGSLVASGWRPPSVNASTPNAAPRSKHMMGLACDVYDPDGDLDDWCLDNLSVLEETGLYLEHPSATKGWCHLQTKAPNSGKRVFYP